MNDTDSNQDSRPPLAILLIVAGLLFAVGFYFLNRGEMPQQKQYVTQQITLVAPPPPPPPPVEEKKIEPEEIIEAPQEAEVQKDVEQVSAEPSPEPASSEPAGLNRSADIGADNFRLAAGKGGGLFGRGGGGGGSWDAFVTTHIRRALQNDPRTRTASGYLEILLSIDLRGRFERAELQSSTGDAALDAAIRDVLAHLEPLSRGRPPSLPSITVSSINIRATER